MKKRIDVVALLAKGERINRAVYEAARHFQEDFSIAGLEGIRSIDYSCVGGGTGPGNPVETAAMASKRIGHVMDRLGGMGSVSGRVIWDIVGLGRNMSEWAAANGYEGKEAKGILLGALDQLARAYGFV